MWVDVGLTGKKGTVVWPLVGMFGWFHELRLFWIIMNFQVSQDLSEWALSCLVNVDKIYEKILLSSINLRLEKKGLDCWSTYDRKKGTVIWPLVGMFWSGHWLECLGGSTSSDCFRGFLDQSTNYYRKKNVQSSGHQLECLGVPWARIVLVGSLIKLRLEKKVQLSGRWFECLGGSMSSDCSSNYDWKKGTVLWPSVGMFGGLHELWLLIKLPPEKGTIVWPLVGMFGWFLLAGCCWREEYLYRQTYIYLLILLFYNECETLIAFLQ